MSKKTKLSAAQMRLLTGIRGGHRYAAPYYPPACKLVELGLAEWDGCFLYITKLGREVLACPN